MIYTFRFEYGARPMQRDIRQFYWNEMPDGRLHQGWGRSGMSLLSPSVSLLTEEEWVPNYLAAAKRARFQNVREAYASSKYSSLVHMCEMKPGDLLVVLNISESGRNGLALVTATRNRSKMSYGCYGWEEARTKNNPLGDDHRHYITINSSELSSLYVPYGTKTADGRRAARLKTTLRPFQKCVAPIHPKHSEFLVK